MIDMSRLGFLILLILMSSSITTVISGLYERDLTYRLGASITGHGFPLSWYVEVVIIYPGYPTCYSLSMESFVIDIMFWSMIIGVLTVMVFRLKNRFLLDYSAQG